MLKFTLFMPIQHLKLKHPMESKLCEDLKRAEEAEKVKSKRPKLAEKQPTLLQVLEKTQKYNKTSPQQKSLDDCLLEMLILDMQPASVVEDLGFRRFVNMLDPRYDIPSRRTLMRRLPTKYEEIKLHILKVLPKVMYVRISHNRHLDITSYRKLFDYNCAFHSFLGAEKFSTCYN